MPAHTDSGLKIARIPADRNRQARPGIVLHRERRANERRNKYFPVLLGSGPTEFVPKAVARSEVRSRAGQHRQLAVRVPTNASLVQAQVFRVLWKKQSRCEIRGAAKYGANVLVSSRHTAQSKPRAHPRLGLEWYFPSLARLMCRSFPSKLPQRGRKAESVTFDDCEFDSLFRLSPCVRGEE
jgi:hypothetical protein